MTSLQGKAELLILAVVLTTTAATQSLSQDDGPVYDVSWHTLDAGGGVSTGGVFEVIGTIGQHDAGPVLAGDGFELLGGFWSCPTYSGRQKWKMRGIFTGDLRRGPIRCNFPSGV